MVTIGYRILLTLNVLHEYFDDKISKNLVVVPTKSTLSVLKNYQMLFKPTEKGGLVLARIVDKDGTLQVPITNADNFKLSFYLKSNSPFFYNRTNLVIPPTQVNNFVPNRVGYYFNNINRVVGNKFEVTGFPKAGEETDLKHLTSTANTEVSTSDEVVFIPSVFRLRFNPQVNSFKIEIKDKTDTVVVPETTFSETENFEEYEIKVAKNLPAGFYKISIDGGAAQHAYISDEAFHQNTFGLVELFHASNLADFNFLKTTGSKIQVKEEADYYLWFKNRKLKWRYVFQGTPPGDIIATAPTVDFDPIIIGSNIFESDAELDLTDSYRTVRTDASKNLPNPDGKVVKAAYDGTNTLTHYFAEVHL